MPKDRQYYLDLISPYLVLAILTTLALSALNLNSYCIVLLLLLTVLKGNLKRGWLHAWQEPFFRSCTLLFLIYLAGAFYASDWIIGIRDVEKRLALIVIPFIFCSKQFIKSLKWEKILLAFTLIVLVISLYCLFIAFYRFYSTGEARYFFYHDLLKPIEHHAIFFSLLAFLCMVYLLEQKEIGSIFRNHYLRYLIVCYFILFIVLLSSKLILSFVILYLIYKTLKEKKLQFKIYAYLGLGTLLALLTLVNNPIKFRFVDSMTIDKEKFTSKDLSQYYFNGLEFRLIQWKLVAEILQEKKKWLAGVSPADAQDILNEKYKDYNFYQGEAARGDKGYLDYNAHNQFLQCLLQSGIIGLLGFIYVCCMLARLAIKSKFSLLQIISALLIALCFTESVLQTQKGLVSFTLLPLLIAYTSRSGQSSK